MKTLKEAKVGQTVKVVKLHGEGAIRRQQCTRLSQPILRDLRKEYVK